MLYALFHQLEGFWKDGGEARLALWRCGCGLLPRQQMPRMVLTDGDTMVPEIRQTVNCQR